MVQWWWNNALWYAKADATPSGLSCTAGEPLPLAFNSGGNAKGAIYFGAAPTTCHVDAGSNTLVIDIPLTLVGKSAKDKAFDRTAAIYKAAGAADKFTRE